MDPKRRYEIWSGVSRAGRVVISGIDEVREVAEALWGVAEVYEDEDGKVGGIGILASERVVPFPPHGIAEVKGRGRTWAEVFAPSGVEVVERTTLDGRIRRGDWVLYQEKPRVVARVGEGDWLSLVGSVSATYESAVGFATVPASAVVPCTPQGRPL
jgi:hypothetical protein